MPRCFANPFWGELCMDLANAFKQLPVSSLDAEAAGICLWSPDARAPVVLHHEGLRHSTVLLWYTASVACRVPSGRSSAGSFGYAVVAMSMTSRWWRGRRLASQPYSLLKQSSLEELGIEFSRKASKRLPFDAQFKLLG
eukprot:4953452-Amphidinium_carterae.1